MNMKMTPGEVFKLKERLHAIKAGLKLDDRKLASSLEVDLSSVRRWYSGTRPRTKHMIKIAQLEQTVPVGFKQLKPPKWYGAPLAAGEVTAPVSQPEAAQPPVVQIPVKPDIPGVEKARELAALEARELVLRLDEYMKQNGLDCNAMAGRLSVSCGTAVRNWLTGKHMPIGVSRAAIIREISGVPYIKVEGRTVIVREPAPEPREVVREVVKEIVKEPAPEKPADFSSRLKDLEDIMQTTWAGFHWEVRQEALTEESLAELEDLDEDQLQEFESLASKLVDIRWNSLGREDKIKVLKHLEEKSEESKVSED